MSSADPFLPVQGVPVDLDEQTTSRPPAGVEVDPPVDDVAEERERAADPDPEGDGDTDEGMPPATSGPFHGFAGGSVDPASRD